MSVTDKVSTTMTWAKQVTTGTFKSVTGTLLKSSFLNRNKKPLAIYGAVCLIGIILSWLLVRSAATDFRQEFLNKAVIAANAMAEKVSAPLLENDILTLNVSIGELEKKIAPVFAGILDHEGIVIAHSDPEAMNLKMKAPEKTKKMTTLDEVTVEKEVFHKYGKTITFSKDLFYSKVKIGTLVFGLDAQTLAKSEARYHLMLLAVLALNVLIFLLLVFMTDRHLRNKAAKELEAFENMEKVGPYMLKKKIAQGGMAELFLADYIRDDGFKRTVAIKKILPHLAQNQDFVAMFIREARLAAMLQHPNIVQIFDLIKLMNLHFIAMEYVNGKNLAEIMAHEKSGLPVELALFLIQKISSGLHYSHSKTDDQSGEPLNIVHRDISPQNMLVSFRGEVKISDFGISKARSEPSFTQAGVIKGKLSYLSPEQALGKEVDHQADIYALGIIFHEILTGKRLYDFSNELEAIRTIPTMKIPDLTELRPDLPKALADIIAKCLEKDKARRYQTAKELHDDLASLKSELQISFDASNLATFMADRFKNEDLS
ncbi:MAG: serine/threonine protein kinase [Desulfobacteraceae bacterium]|nr:serine/threonine protein kinase [Desulfobacteraceae bacterium]